MVSLELIVWHFDLKHFKNPDSKYIEPLESRANPKSTIQNSKYVTTF
jgi:hypothetical protein